MPVPNSIDDLSTTEAENSPQGTETAKGTIDNYFRRHASFIAQLRDLMSSAQDELRATVRVEQFGAIGNGVFDCTNAVLSAVAAVRGVSVDINNGLFPPESAVIVTSYSSGVVEFGPGVFVISADALDFTQEMGLTLRGKGSRGANNAVRAATTLLISGTSSGFGLRAMGNGARNLRIRDLDICYATTGFTGHLLDLYGVPGTNLRDTFLGTAGLTGGTRLKTAASLIRATYDEFLQLDRCVLDGAVDMLLFDNSRGVFEFGGSMTQLNNTTFYDCTGTMIKQDATRSRRGLQLNNCTFNPIDIAGVRAIDLGNVQGVTINGGLAIGSVGHAPTEEWFRMLNCTGHVHGFLFGDYSKAGTFGGWLDLSNNVVDTTDGLNMAYGVITGKGNRFRYGANGWKQAGTPLLALNFDVGPDFFAAGVTNTHSINPADSTVSGRITLAREQDGSSANWINTSASVKVEHADQKTIPVSAANYNISILDSGRTIAATSVSAQQFIMPPPLPGTRLRITTDAQNFTLVTSVNYPFKTGTGGVKTSMNKIPADIGCAVEAVADGTTGWFVYGVGTWTYA